MVTNYTRKIETTQDLDKQISIGIQRVSLDLNNWEP